ncbi:TPA_asm: P3 [Ficus alphacytorhabdovirus 1]|nr:TPA_asm: P3 [Ficus alphacytorhabdovirus 1]
MALVGKGTISFKIKTELIAGSENNVISLTKKMNLFESIAMRSVDNIRVKMLRVIYRPRTGLRGAGKIHARVKDNRVDGDIADQVIHQMEFCAGSAANLEWSSSMWFAKTDLNQPEPPLILEMELSECNMMSGFSIAQIIIIVELTGATNIERFTYKTPRATIKSDPIAANAALDRSNSFSTRDMRVALTASEEPDASEEVKRLRSVARDTIRSQSSRISRYRGQRAIR